MEVQKLTIHTNYTMEAVKNDLMVIMYKLLETLRVILWLKLDNLTEKTLEML